jgi:hypothetical protein
MAKSSTLVESGPGPGTAVDDTNHDLVHTLSARMDGSWHLATYAHETRCPGCRQVFERLREMDREAVRLLSAELKSHIKSNRFPLDLTD